MVCLVIEDEEHAIFHCVAHTNVRAQFRDIISRYTSVQDIVDPQSDEDMEKISSLLSSIEGNMERFNLIR